MYKFTGSETIPSSWAVTTLSTIAEVNPSMNFSDYEDDALISFVPMPLVEELTGRLDSSRLERVGKVKKGYTRFRDGDVLFAKITPCMENGKIAIAENLHGGIGAGSTEFHVLRARGESSNRYILYYLLQNDFRGDAQHHMTGMVGQKRVPAKYIEDSEIPLPPLNEQRRIVSKIEELFSDLDEGEAALRRVQSLLAGYRQAVLKAAVTGELTKEWREANQHRLESGEALLQRILQARREQWNGRGKYQESQPPDLTDLPELPVGWHWTTLEQLIDHIEAGKSPVAENRPAQPHELGVLKVSALSWGQFLPLENKVVKEMGKFSPDMFVRENDLLISRANTVELVGAVVLVEKDYPNLLLSDKTLRLVPVSEDIDRTYLLHMLRTNVVRSVYEELATGTKDSMRNLSQGKILSAPIPLCSLAEQRRISEEIGRLFSVVQATEKAAIENRNRSDGLRQSILKAAFSGKLVPQDPSDEPARVLFERIQAARQSSNPSKPTSRTGAKTQPKVQPTLWESS